MDYNSLSDNIFEAKINENKFTGYISQYLYFSEVGYQTIYFKLKNRTSYSFSIMFRDNKNLTSVFFSNKMKNKNIINMDSMFSGCI